MVQVTEISVWKSADGQLHNISQMSSSHLKNTINFINDKVYPNLVDLNYVVDSSRYNLKDLVAYYLSFQNKVLDYNEQRLINTRNAMQEELNKRRLLSNFKVENNNTSSPSVFAFYESLYQRNEFLEKEVKRLQEVEGILMDEIERYKGDIKELVAILDEDDM